MPDTLWHLAGWAIALLGAPLLARALLADRAKGRRRCPKCWYSMDGVPATPPDAAHPSAKPTYLCPECGHTTRTEKSLLKTRRRLKLLPLTVIAILMGYSVWSIPRLQREGAKGLIPTTYLILTVPYPETDFLAPQTQRHQQLQNILQSRARDPYYRRPPELYAWQNHLWDWSLRYRFAREHRSGLPSAAHATLAKLDATSVVTPQRLYLSDLATLVQDATGIAVQVTDDGDQLLELDAGSTSAAIALDKACASLHNQSRWSITDQGIIITPSNAAAPPVFDSHSVGDLLDLRQIGDLKTQNGQPSPSRVWVDNAAELQSALLSLIHPDDWIHNGGGNNYAYIVGSRLYVVADPVVQLRISQLIDGLYTAKSQGQAKIPVALKPAVLDPIGRSPLSIAIYDAKPYLEPWGIRGVRRHLYEAADADAWEENGGHEASITTIGHLLIVRAPDRVHSLVVDKLAYLKGYFKSSP